LVRHLLLLQQVRYRVGEQSMSLRPGRELPPQEVLKRGFPVSCYSPNFCFIVTYDYTVKID
jgi:hypothetical protein